MQSAPSRTTNPASFAMGTSLAEAVGAAVGRSEVDRCAPDPAASPRIAKPTLLRGPRGELDDPAAEEAGRSLTLPDAAVASGGNAPTFAPPLERELLYRSADIVEAFLTRIEGEDSAAPAAPWGDKVGYSVYDEEELLGPYVDMGDEYLDEFLDEFESEEEENIDGASSWGGGHFDDDDDDDDSDDGSGGADAYVVDATVPDSALPRAARLVKPLCCVDRLETDLPERCPICLEGLSVGQTSWRLPCMHAFHDVCMIRYLGAARRDQAGGGPTCPTCRGDIRRLAAEPPAQVEAAART